MTTTLRFTDGSTTVTVTTGDMYLAKYTPQTAVDLTAPLKESAQVRFYRSNASIRSNVQLLNRLFVQAASYQSNRTGPKVYVEFDPGDTGDVYRSLLFSGAVHPMERLLGEEWTNNNVGMTLEWTRQPFWEGPLAQIPLTNSSATDDLTGIAVNNCNYSATGVTCENWVDIDGADILGDYPAPIKLVMENTKNGADETDEIFVWHNVHSNPSDLNHIIEAETDIAAYANPDSDVTCSDGYKDSIIWASSSETKIAEWTLSDTTLGYTAGGKFVILARWAGLFPYDDCWVRMKLETTTNYYDVLRGDLAKVSPIENGRELTILDTMRLPPYLQGDASLRELALTMYARHAGSSSEVDLDYIQLSPISGDSGWLWFRSVARGVPYGNDFVHDDTEGVTYRTDDSNKKIAEFSQRGGPILLEPNQDQRLYFNTSDYNGYAKIDQTWSVQLWYRPRRASI